MYTEVLPQGTITVLKKVSPLISDWRFYLGGGSSLSLQFGHRISEDLDLFCMNPFNFSKLLSLLRKESFTMEEILGEENTLLGILDGVKFSFFYYPVPLLFKSFPFEGIEVADWRDIIAEKIKTIAQRGSKKDFYDLFEVFYSKWLSIKETVRIFKRKFNTTGINFYHVLKSLVYFEDADLEPDPIYIKKPEPQWDQIKKFFVQNIQEFSEEMLTGD